MTGYIYCIDNRRPPSDLLLYNVRFETHMIDLGSAIGVTLFWKFIFRLKNCGKKHLLCTKKSRLVPERVYRDHETISK